MNKDCFVAGMFATWCIDSLFNFNWIPAIVAGFMCGVLLWDVYKFEEKEKEKGENKCLKK